VPPSDTQVELGSK